MIDICGFNFREISAAAVVRTSSEGKLCMFLVWFFRDPEGINGVVASTDYSYCPPAAEHQPTQR